MEGGVGQGSTSGLMDTLLEQFSDDQSPNQVHNSSLMLLQADHNNPSKNETVTNPSGYLMDISNSSTDGGIGNSSSSSTLVKAKIMSHPHYNRLVAAYISCQKIGAPPEVVARLEEINSSVAAMGGGTARIGDDPALDQFMEAYCEMLTKYEQELCKTFTEAVVSLSRIESQFQAISSSDSASVEDNGMHNNLADPQAEDEELKSQLLRKYSGGYLENLKQEFTKKRKKGKLPNEARQQLLQWWTRNYKWPYPSESQKLALGQATGLDQKQINNWFINQRKRHWRPLEDMQFMVMNAAHPHHYYMNNVAANPIQMDISSPFL
ncbi:hypothetical protein ACET3Z_032835 [Daucus carota]